MTPARFTTPAQDLLRESLTILRDLRLRLHVYLNPPAPLTHEQLEQQWQAAYDQTLTDPDPQLAEREDELARTSQGLPVERRVSAHSRANRELIQVLTDELPEHLRPHCDRPGCGATLPPLSDRCEECGGLQGLGA